jgi:hypothetical protein
MTFIWFVLDDDGKGTSVGGGKGIENVMKVGSKPDMHTELDAFGRVKDDAMPTKPTNSTRHATELSREEKIAFIREQATKHHRATPTDVPLVNAGYEVALPQVVGIQAGG